LPTGSRRHSRLETCATSIWQSKLPWKSILVIAHVKALFAKAFN
jgi:hypothetical protein